VLFEELPVIIARLLIRFPFPIIQPAILCINLLNRNLDLPINGSAGQRIQRFYEFKPDGHKGLVNSSPFPEQ